ncbi:MAG TPA: efflux RND transporter permease subunit, partial [Opitutaceae bacterium]|nr:efflux RND transporter permease subunit [Opitutaceae bacterium]
RKGEGRLETIQQAIGEIFKPLVGSTLTPVVVFIPLAFLEGLTGVFFRTLALTMVVSLLTSLVLAVTVTPSLAAWFIRPREKDRDESHAEGGRFLRRIIDGYEHAVRFALRNRFLTLTGCVAVFIAGIFIYTRLKSDFLPPMDESGFVIDYRMPWGTSLAETNRQLLQVDKFLRETPEVEGYSRRTGARLALAIAEPNTGDFLVKLREDRKRSTAQVISDLRKKIVTVAPNTDWDLHDILGELIGDLTGSPKPIEVKLYSTDTEFLKKKAPEIEEKLKSIRGVVDTFHGLVFTGPTISLRVRSAEAQRYGLNANAIAATVNTAMHGRIASSVLEGDRVVNVRVRVDRAGIGRLSTLRELPLRTADGSIIQLSQVADVVEEPGQVELQREDLRQNVSVTARLEGRDLGSAVDEIRRTLGSDDTFPTDAIEYGGTYEQQQESFKNLLLVLAMAIMLVFVVLLIEFRSFYAPIAIVFGAILALFGTVLSLWITGTTLNVVSFLGAIIGVGIVAKNGILMLDFVDHLRTEGLTLSEALVRSGRRRLRPVLMTSLAAALGMLPLAYGIGSGADMLKPMAIAVIGALAISVLLSLIATPVLYSVLSALKPEGPIEKQAG